MPLLPQKLQIARNRSLDKVLRFYNQEFVKRMNLRRRMFGPSDDFDFPWPGGRFQWVAFSYASRQLSGGYWQELCEAEFSYPFTHRPLVEFMLAIPIVQKVRPGESKSLLRRALRDFLPPELVNHKERITNLDAMVHAVARERSRIQGMFKNARSSAYGYLNSEAILESCNHKRKQADPFIMSLVPFEYWLQSLDRRWINRTSGTERVPARLHLGGLTTANQQTGAANTKMLFKDDPKRCGIWFV